MKSLILIFSVILFGFGTAYETGNISVSQDEHFISGIENQNIFQNNGGGLLNFGSASGNERFTSYGSAIVTIPRIASLEPPKNAINVNRSSDIKIIFDQDINPATINSDNIMVYGMQSGYVLSTLTYDNPLRELTIDPEIDFRAGEEINVTLNSGIKNFSGDSLIPYSFGFTIEAVQGTAIFSQNFLIQDSTLHHICSGDIDRDGDMDILANIINYWDYRAIYVYKREANGYYYQTFRFFEQMPLADPGISDLILRDMDNDGYLDAVVILSGMGNLIMIFYNNGSGSFGDPVEIYLERCCNYFIFDFDSDGDNDILWANYPCGLEIFSNTGNHQFERICLNLNEYQDFYFRTCSDFDNDGDIDIINATEILVNNGNLSFSRLLNSVPDGLTGDMKDFDDDGDPDMITSVGSQIYLHRNNGNGIFSDSTLISSGNYSYLNISNDFNADGSFDIIMYDSTADKNAIFSNNGSGYFNFLSYTDSSGFSPLFSNDIDSDGDIDIIGRKNKFLFALLNEPNIHSTPVVNPAKNEVNVNRSADITAVFDNDLDASTINDSTVKVFGYETGLLQCSKSYDASQKKITIDPVKNFKTGEKINVILTSGIRSSTQIPISPFTWTFTTQATAGTGIFTEVNIIDTAGSEFGAQIVSGDFNGDGKPDLAQMNARPKVYIYFNDGNADFNLTQIISNSASTTGGSLACADFDNDGDLDLFLSFLGTFINGSEDTIYIYKNNGNGFFTKSFTANYNSGYRLKPVVDDFDADGDLDIVSSISEEPRSLNLFINDGTGNLTQSFLPYPTGFARSITSGDIDNDGDMDLISIRDDSPFIYGMGILLNNGNAGFSIRDWEFNGNILKDFCANADIDSDGDIDIITSGFTFFNNGTGYFLYSYEHDSSGIFGQIILADLDSDGDIDKTEIDNLRGVNIYQNNGMGRFSILQNIHGGEFPFFGTSGDFDDDGDIDLAISNEFGHNFRSDISILLNDYNCGTQYSISGNTTIPVGSENNIYISSADRGYWNISNFDSTQASIPPDSEGDTVLVSAGNRLGHFVLYYTAHRDCGGDTLLSYHVYVDYPSPVELAAFASVVYGRDVTLNWTTSNELNNSGFEIERSDKSDEWTSRGNVEGSGTTNEPRQYSFTDKNLNSGNYKYRLKQIDYNGNFEYYELEGSVSIGIPDKFSLSQNYPNPFNPVTNVEFEIPEQGLVSLKVYDVTGREVITLVNEIKEPGYYTVKFNAVNLSSGVYFYRMTAGDFTAVKKFVVLK